MRLVINDVIVRWLLVDDVMQCAVIGLNLTRFESLIIWQTRDAISAVRGRTDVLIRNSLTKQSAAHCFTPSAVSLFMVAY